MPSSLPEIRTWNGKPVRGRRVLLAMSGGVDSSCAALILKRQGAEVIGVTLRLFDSEKSDRAVADAETVCDRLRIDHVVLDIRDTFENRVIRPFVDAYRNGKTPNPCLGCNPRIKWTAILETFTAHDASTLFATGHYVKVGRGPGNTPALYRGAGKDQSYFLSRLTRRQISRTIFPVGNLLKPDLRQLAAEAGLPVAQRPDSQEVCFIEHRRYIDFLDEHFRGGTPPPGDIVHIDGTVLGRHAGIHRYTIGQRQGLGIAYRHPLYVVRIDAGTNRIIVGPKDAAYTRVFLADGIVWSGAEPPSDPITARVQVRYRHTPTACIITPLTPNARRCRIRITGDPASIAPGQGAAFYSGDRLLGGGEIIESLPESET